jgi:hypothetical protein
MQLLQASLEFASNETARSYAMLNVDTLLLTKPTVDNPRNIIDFHLHQMYYKVRHMHH